MLSPGNESYRNFIPYQTQKLAPAKYHGKNQCVIDYSSLTNIEDGLSKDNFSFYYYYICYFFSP